ncbi:hypothetical protein B0181_08340 [Moraxella caviae]|uniref:Recombination protein O n=1 Tax=Moraxella caviae TaxID=34060 RepID=A0A1S9ZY50_9GAMM|nr:recombination protein O N-terminal domain-containing protein [Moraxella caviae]OOR88359.1 hypothetical protein B0181_08340 [Moraxella caviae]STZ10614.1 Recombination protein O [Moraxella caviae]
MKNHPLTGYILHARPYQEKRAIYQLFSSELGVVHGVGVRGVPSFAQVDLFATGKNTLKSFSQITIANHSAICALRGQSQYARLYINELLCRLLAPENPCPDLWQKYREAMGELDELGVIDEQAGEQVYRDKLRQMKLCLRKFERALFDELGVSFDFFCDYAGQPLAAGLYRFVPDTGFVALHSERDEHDDGEDERAAPNFHKSRTYQDGVRFDGSVLPLLADEANFAQHLTPISQLHKQMIDFLLDYKPLNSRKLWLEQKRYH